MKNIELEEGEAFFLEDDDENIDPDLDFSYIDWKVENLLGEYRKDFMSGYSTECRGPRYGDYGSFLPMYERSPPLLQNQRNQSHASSKPPSRVSTHLPENHIYTGNTSLPVKTVPVPNDTGKYLFESGISNVSNQFEVKNSTERVSNQQQQSEKPIIHQPAQNSLKFRVTMGTKSVLPQDNTAIYSGLGLDMSPMSSEGTPLEFDYCSSPDIRKIELESPSFIIKIMTSVPLPLNESLMSPLHGDLMCLVEKTLENSLSGIGQAEPLNIVHDNPYLEGKKAASDERKPKLNDTGMDMNLKQKETSKDRKLKRSIIKQKPVKLVKEEEEFQAYFSDLGSNRREEIGALGGHNIVSNTSKETNILSDSRPSIVFDKKNEGNLSKIRITSENDENKIVIPKVEPGTNKGNEIEESKFLKQHRVKDIMIEEDFDSGCPNIADDYRKKTGKQEKIAKDKEIGFVFGEDVKPNNIHFNLSDSEYLESSKKSDIKPMPHLKMDPNLEEPSSSLVKKKLQDRQTGNASSIKQLSGNVARWSDPEAEDTHRNIPSRNKRIDIDLPKNLRKDSDVVLYENPSKKWKEVSSREIVAGSSIRDAQPSASKMKEQLSSKKPSFANTGPKFEEVAGGNYSRERVLSGELPPPENSSLVPLETDDWVQCEKCEKWRLLPFGINPNSLPKEWICSMLTWLPGMNKCSVSEDETTQALRMLYLPSAPGSGLQVQNHQRPHLGGVAPAKASSAIQNIALSDLVTDADVLLSSGKKNLVKLETDATVKSGAQDLRRFVKKDLQLPAGIRNPKNLKRLPLETACPSKNAVGSGSASKIPKKRMSEAEVSGVPKKMKNVHHQYVERPIVLGLPALEVKVRNQNYDRDAFRVSRNVAPRSSECVPSKVKNRSRSMMIAMDAGVNDVSEKKRKLKDQQSIEVSEPIGNGQHKGSKVGPNTLDPFNVDRLSRKTVNARKSPGKACDLGLSDNATTSSSSKVSIKVKAKASEVKCSPGGSISSSPMKVSKSEPDKWTNKVISYDDPEESSSRKRQKLSIESAFACQELPQHKEESKSRNSNLSRISGMMSDTAHEDHLPMKMPSGKQSSAHRVDLQPKLENFELRDGKLDHRNTQNQMSNGFYLNGTLSGRQKSLAPEMGGEKELSIYSHQIPNFEKGSGSNSVRVDDDDGKLSRPVSNNHVSFRHPHQSTNTPRVNEASSSKKLDNFHIAAKTALKEAKDLKHSANRLKTVGSGLSTGIFFQAALKFLHGASLLEPETGENGRMGETVSSEVYSSTAKLCEYCAHEYEKCNDMASASLAYKCMEVAYMRVVYSNDVAASRDRVELQMAVRATPQVESPSSSASDIDNLNNQVVVDSVRDGPSLMDHRSHVISARNRPDFVRLLNFTHDINLAMEASRRSQGAFAVANPILLQEGNEEGISSIKRVLDFSFHDVDGLLHLVRLAMEALNN